MTSDARLNRAVAGMYWETLSRRALAVVEGEVVRIYDELAAHAPWAPLNCDLASAAWVRAFGAAGVPVSLRHGNYDPDHIDGTEHAGSTDHTWLIVDRHLFDPTAAQFGSPIERGAYFDDEAPHPHSC